MKTYQSHDNTGTPEQWAEYYKKRAEFEANMRAIEPDKDSPEYSKWAMAYHCDAPNVPGYHFANND